MSLTIKELSFFSLTLIIMFHSATCTISCYQCLSTDHKDPFQCGEYMTDDIDMEPTSCENVYGAAYCIKQTGRFEACGISCYQCTSATNIDCGNELIHDTRDSSVEPTGCGFLFEARYCIKTTGLHSGGLGTKRFCSSLDLGNYCNYIRQPGDVMEYRSCVYTCDSDGCNRSSLLHNTDFTYIFTTLSTIIILAAKNIYVF